MDAIIAELQRQITELQRRLEKESTLEGGGGGGAIPIDLIAFYGGGAAPAGFAEFTMARGLCIVGMPAGGTLLGTVGAALTDLQDRTHTHTGASHVHSLSQDGDNTHGLGTKIVTGDTGSDGTLYTASGAGTSGGVGSATVAPADVGTTGTSAFSTGFAYIQCLSIIKV